MSFSVKLPLMKCLCRIKTKKLLLITVVRKPQSLVLLFTRRVVLLVLSIGPNVPISPKGLELKWIITMPRNTLEQLLGLFMNVKYVTFTAFTFCERKSWKNIAQREVKELKVLILHNQWEMLMTKGWKRNYRPAYNFAGQCDMDNGRYRV